MSSVVVLAIVVVILAVVITRKRGEIGSRGERLRLIAIVLALFAAALAIYDLLLD